METKREKFIRLAESRVNKILKQLSLLSNLSNKSAYQYTDEDVSAIIRTLKTSVNDLEKSFGKKNIKSFTLTR